MHNHNLYVVTKSEDLITEVLGVYDGDYITLDDLLEHYKQMFNNSNSYRYNEDGLVDVLDEDGMLLFCIEVNKTSAFIANK